MMNLTWYHTLNQPPLTPPAWIFQPAWAILYATIFVSFIIFAFKKYNGSKLWGYIMFFSQLILNFSWSPVFFYFQNVGLALVIIILLDILVLYTIIEFFKVSKTSAYLLLPYFIWLIFATYLNAGIHVLN